MIAAAPIARPFTLHTLGDRAACPGPPEKSAARLLSGNAFQPAASLKALTCFKDGDLGRPYNQ